MLFGMLKTYKFHIENHCIDFVAILLQYKKEKRNGRYKRMEGIKLKMTEVIYQIGVTVPSKKIFQR